MKKITALLAVGTLATLLSGCIISAGGHDHDYDHDNDWKQRQAENRTIISRLKIGSPIQVVTSQLGDADDSEGFTKEDKQYIVLYYRTRHRHSDGETSLDETTPLVFSNGELMGWGFALVDSIRP